MKVIAFVNKDSGVSYHRLICPLLLLKDVDVFITNNLLEEHFKDGCDLLVYNRTLPESAAPIIKKLQQQHGFRILVDIDDYWHLDPHHVLYDFYLATDFAATQRKHLREADVVTTTHERLAERIRPYNKNVHVLPNAIPKVSAEAITMLQQREDKVLLHYFQQFVVERTPSEFIRLFWQGSDTHRADIQIIASTIDRLGPLSPKIKMIMSGYAEGNEQWRDMVMAYTAGLKHQYKLIPFAPVSSYYSAYAEADICLVPLVNSLFNRMKSNLKVLEAANLGLPCIVSNTHPYKNLPVLYASQPGHWLNNIKRLVANANMREDLGRKLQEHCDEYFNFSKINEERRQVMEYTINKTTANEAK